METEKKEVALRSLGIALSVAEAAIGVALIGTSGGTNPLGYWMAAHGTANTIASIHSMNQYLKSDGNTELPTSALGLGTYKVLDAAGVNDTAKNITCSLVDTGDSLLPGANLSGLKYLDKADDLLFVGSGAEQAVKNIDKIQKFNTVEKLEKVGTAMSKVGISDNVGLLVTTAQDEYQKHTDNKTFENKDLESQIKYDGNGNVRGL